MHQPDRVGADRRVRTFLEPVYIAEAHFYKTTLNNTSLQAELGNSERCMNPYSSGRKVSFYSDRREVDTHTHTEIEDPELI